MCCVTIIKFNVVNKGDNEFWGCRNVLVRSKREAVVYRIPCFIDGLKLQLLAGFPSY